MPHATIVSRSYGSRPWKVRAPREHDHREKLRPRPVEHVGERDDLVLLAVDHDGIGRHRGDLEALDSGTGEHEALGLDALRDPGLHVRAERESAEGVGKPPAEAIARVVERRERVFALAVAVVEAALRRADAAEVEAHRDVVERVECLRERLRDLVVERAALLRIRVRDSVMPRRAVSEG